MKRAKYLVRGVVDLTMPPEAPMEVFADEISVTQTGDLMFGQVRDVKVMDQGGVVKTVKDMVTVLVVAKGSYAYVEQISDAGTKLYTESGVVEIIN